MRRGRRHVSLQVFILLILGAGLVLPGWFFPLAAGAPTQLVSNIGPGPPLFFSNVNGFPQAANFSGMPALRLVPSQSNAYGGLAWNALRYSGQPLGLSIIGGYSTSGGLGPADGFTIIMFARNGTFAGRQVNYANSSIPVFNACSGICGAVALPNSTSNYVALQWDPFYAARPEFNLWVINSTSNIIANAQSIGCSIGVPAAGDRIALNATYSPSGNSLQASVSDQTTTISCSFIVGLSQYRFSNVVPGNYWAMVEGNTGGGTADWTILRAQTVGTGPPPYVGRVCLVPGNSPACPQTIPDMVSDSTGHLDVSVNILGSPGFNAFGIALHWDAGVMNATGVDLTNTVLQNPSVSTRCLNGGGINCGAQDGLGVAHLDVSSSNLTGTTAPASGQLFRLSLIGPAGVNPHLGFARGCSTVGFAPGFSGSGSVPNTDACVFVGLLSVTICTTLCTIRFSTVPEGMQSQMLGIRLPTTLSSASPPGNVTSITSGGTAPNFDDTWILPKPVSLYGNITGWKAQFTGGIINSSIPSPSTPAYMQLKVLRPQTLPNLLTVVETAPVHAPGPVLANRTQSYPFVKTEWTVIPYYTDTLLTVQPGDFIGVTISSNRTLSAWYNYPFTNQPGGTRFVRANVTLGSTIDLSSSTTFTIAGLTPVIEVNIQPSPPRLDTSGDGIPDFVALSPEMQAFNVDPCRKNVLVQIDYMVSADGLYTFRPLPDTLSTVVHAFDIAPVPAITSCPYQGFPRKQSGINLVFDVRNQIPTQTVVSFFHSEPLSFDSVKATFFDTNRVQYFHYGLFVNHTIPGTTQSGAGEVFGANFIVSLGQWHNQVGTVAEQAGTLMHELGHNLGLQHGGSDDINYKSNYLSVMSYEHQVVGITTWTPTGDITRFDYSREAMPSLDESSLNGWVRLSISNDYTKFVCPDHHTTKIVLVSSPIDWSCSVSGTVPASARNDINNDTAFEILNGYNDWANLRYSFTQSDNFNIGCVAHCDIGCVAHCDIGCVAHCDIGNHLDFPTAQQIEATWSAFLATQHDRTSGSVTCSPTSVIVNNPTSCTATVSDASGTIVPSGTVSFLSSQGTFSPTTCSLVATGTSASCSVKYTPAVTSVGLQTITSGYTGDAGHLGVSATAMVTGLQLPTVTVASNTTLTSDLTGRVVVASDNVTFNCNGHTIRGITTDPLPGSYPGILLNGRHGVIVENCVVSNFYLGIQLSSSSVNLLLRDSAIGDGYGFVVSSSTVNALVLDNATNNLHDGFRLVSSNITGVVGNRANNNLGSGFLLVGSSGNGLALNTANGNGAYGFALTLQSNNNLVQGNSACTNAIFDAYQDSTSTGNTYKNNAFCTSSGLPSKRGK